MIATGMRLPLPGESSAAVPIECAEYKTVQNLLAESSTGGVSECKL